MVETEGEAGLTPTGFRKRRWPRGRLIVDLNENIVRREHVTRRGAPRVIELLAALVEAEGRFVAFEKLATKVYGAKRPPNYDKSLRNVAARARQLIEPLGYEIRTQRALVGSNAGPAYCLHRLEEEP